MKTEKNTANITTKISLFDSVLPIFFLILLLFLNVYIFYGDSALEGSNQFILLTGAFLAILVGVKNKVNMDFYRAELNPIQVLRDVIIDSRE